MICKRCGTEYPDHLTECPRCTFGRVTVRKPLPKWAVGLISGFGSLAVIVLATVLFFTLRFDDDWMNGNWTGTDFYLTFNTEDGTCAFSNGDSLVVGTYKADKDSFTLYTDDGLGYTYQYTKLSNYEMDLSYLRDGELRTLFVCRSGYADDEDPETDERPQEDPTETPEQPPENNTPIQPVEKPTQKPSGNQKPSENKPVQTPIVDIPALEEKPDEKNEFEELAGMPVLYLNTQNGISITSREEYVRTEVKLSNAEGYNFGATSARVRGRGNSTWLHFDKKPYRLKFDEKVDLLGMGANKDWVLLANAFDETMMRNYIAFSLGHEFGLEYTTEFRFVHLFLNGEYRGVYMIAEQIEEGNSRVDVNSSKTGEVDTGYLIEAIGNNTKEEEERYFLAKEVDGKRLYKKQKEFRFYIKSPNEAECTDAQLAFIEDYVDRVNEAIFKKDWETICALVDVDSMAKMFLVDQITLNNDMGYCFYLYKKAGDKLYFGPMWDYDQSCGGSSWGGTTFSGWKTGTTHTWYTSLIEIPEFQKLVQKIYKEHSVFIRNLPVMVTDVIEENAEDFAMNNLLWSDLFGDPKKWRRVDELVGLHTYEEHVEYLLTWMLKRIIWLEAVLGIK